METSETNSIVLFHWNSVLSKSSNKLFWNISYSAWMLTMKTIVGRFRSRRSGRRGLAVGVVMVRLGVKRRCYSFWYGLAVPLDEWWCARSTRHRGRAVGRWSLSWCFLVDGLLAQCRCWVNAWLWFFGQAKPSQSVNWGRRLARSASRRPLVC